MRQRLVLSLVSTKETDFQPFQQGRRKCANRRSRRWRIAAWFRGGKGRCLSFLSNIIAQINPEGLARRQVARAIVESGEAPDEIARALQQAQVEGQGNFTVADALDNAGQRMPSTVARAPGEGRTAAVNFLENRQAGQGRRVSSALAEGFDTRETAAQTESRLTQARNDADDAEFAAVRNDAKPVIGKII